MITMHAALPLTILLPLVANAQVGGLVPMKLKANDPNVQFAVKSINSYYKNQGDTEPRTLVEIVSAKHQAHGRTVYLELRVKSMNQLELCKVEEWKSKWLHEGTLQLNKDPVCKVSMVKSTTDTQAHKNTTVMPAVTAGSVMVDLNDTDEQNAFTFAIAAINAQDNFKYKRIAVKIEKIMSQAIAGKAYHFRGVHLAATTCTNSTMTPTTDLKSCILQDPKDVKTCDFDILWWKNWMEPEYKLTNFRC